MVGWMEWKELIVWVLGEGKIEKMDVFSDGFLRGRKKRLQRSRFTLVMKKNGKCVVGVIERE